MVIEQRRPLKRVLLSLLVVQWSRRCVMVVAGTGHRPNKLGGYGVKAQRRVVRTAIFSLEHLKPERVISGMAIGWDQALARAAVELDIPFVAAVPFESQDSMWPEQSRLAYRELLTLATEVVVVSPGSYSANAMQRRNIWMVDHCTDVLALWNGTSGGTANCIAYARHVKRPIHNAWKHFIASPE
jgi:uncharacterized phage-like protein YoqJ